jgi:ABC-type lipopolysaccharide export system ATPase subunit
MSTEPDKSVPDNEQELQHTIEQTRQQLGDTVEQLVAKTDVKARAKAEAAQISGSVKRRINRLRSMAARQGASLRRRATTSKR